MLRLEPQIGSTAAEAFLRNGYVVVPFNDGGVIDKVATDWLAFSRAGTETLKAWEFDYHRNGDPDDGVIIRDDPAYDRKLFFHYRDRLWPLLASRDIDPGGQYDLLGYCGELSTRVLRQICQLATDIDAHLQLGLVGKMHASNEHVLRLLHYRRAPHGSIIAREHVDRCCITAHIAESHPRLELYLNGAWTHYPVERGTLLLFSSAKLQALCPGAPRAIPHRVIAHDPTNAGTAVERWSMVYFSHVDLLPTG